MPLRVEHGTDTPLIRDQRLYYPPDWYRRLSTTGKLPLFVFLDDGRGSLQFAIDVGIEKLVRSIAPNFHPPNGFDFSGVVALFLEAPQLSGRVENPHGPLRTWSTPAGALVILEEESDSPGGLPPSFDPPEEGRPQRIGAVQSPSATAAQPPALVRMLGLLAAGGSTLAYPIDDLGFVVDSVNQVILGFQTTLGANGFIRNDWPPTNTPDGAIDEDSIFLIAMGTGATLALVALGSAVNTAGNPLFAGVCVLGGTIGGKAINDPAGLFPGVQPVLYAPTVDVASQRLLSVWFDEAASGSLTTTEMQGNNTDTALTALVPADDSALELADIGYAAPQWFQLPWGPPQALPGDYVRMENTHGATINQWADAIQGFAPGTPWVPNGVHPLLPDGLTAVPAQQVGVFGQVANPQVVIWAIEGLPPYFWPTSQTEGVGPRTHMVPWEPLVEIIRFLLNYP